ncbi:MAG: FeoB-associated Cys-rich membrane protein [Deltaproteobacteria bacterium]|nr:FeoB-associated Cys-rich membrane protein [Deltaproteobacteria bacterium]
MENLLAILIVTSAAAYLVRTFYKRWKEPQDCGCGCSSCNVETTCDEPDKGKSQGL